MKQYDINEYSNYWDKFWGTASITGQSIHLQQHTLQLNYFQLIDIIFFKYFNAYSVDISL